MRPCILWWKLSVFMKFENRPTLICTPTPDRLRKKIILKSFYPKRNELCWSDLKISILSNFFGENVLPLFASCVFTWSWDTTWKKTPTQKSTQFRISTQTVPPTHKPYTKTHSQTRSSMNHNEPLPKTNSNFSTSVFLRATLSANYNALVIIRCWR